jgi:RNA polymerase-binding transcription factor DksA
MDTIRTGVLKDRLEKRQNQILLTLRHIEKEQKEAEEFNDWLDHATGASRVRLLERLTDWYRKEATQIDKALARIDAAAYGLCRACHHPIEQPRLAVFPESEFCSGCQDMRESFERV